MRRIVLSLLCVTLSPAWPSPAAADDAVLSAPSVLDVDLGFSLGGGAVGEECEGLFEFVCGHGHVDGALVLGLNPSRLVGFDLRAGWRSEALEHLPMLGIGIRLRPIKSQTSAWQGEHQAVKALTLGLRLDAILGDERRFDARFLVGYEYRRRNGIVLRIDYSLGALSGAGEPALVTGFSGMVGWML
ncbi:MAG: hypothetical protein ACI9MR_001939 [Myxococcota bacterium]|jgi:hypothetical protein